MKKNKIKILISVFALTAVFSVVGIAEAAGGVYVSPASATKNIGNSFDISVGVSETASKVYAVEGTLVFDKLTCKAITVADGVTTQTSPTCVNPYFLLGIPSGTTAGKVLFTVSVSAGSAGQAAISFTGVDIIGEGVSIGSASTDGNYTINAIPKPTPIPSPTPTPKTTTPEVTTPAAPEQPAEQPIEQPVTQAPQPSLLAAIGGVLTLGTGNIWLGIIVGLIVIAIIVYAIYLIRKRKNPKNPIKM